MADFLLWYWYIINSIDASKYSKYKFKVEHAGLLKIIINLEVVLWPTSFLWYWYIINSIDVSIYREYGYAIINIGYMCEFRRYSWNTAFSYS